MMFGVEIRERSSLWSHEHALVRETPRNDDNGVDGRPHLKSTVRICFDNVSFCVWSNRR